jgi:DNA ligase-1
MPPGYLFLEDNATFASEYGWLQDTLNNSGVVFIHEQLKLPPEDGAAKRALESFLEGVLNKGGEGVIIRDPNAIWTPKRVNALLKYKPYRDAEAVITGFTSGRKTDKGSKHLGKIGALITDYKGKRLELSGLTDEERVFAGDVDSSYATDHPGEDMPEDTQGKHFKVGQTVTFKYRELSDDGIPKEARYWRKPGVE